jgi:hypothetical protein
MKKFQGAYGGFHRFFLRHHLPGPALAACAPQKELLQRNIRAGRRFYKRGFLFIPGIAMGEAWFPSGETLFRPWLWP